MSNLRSTRDVLTLPEADAFVRLISDMGQAQDRMGFSPFRGAETWPHPNTINAINRLGLEPEEVAEWRNLMGRGFTSEAAANVLIRSRRNGDA